MNDGWQRMKIALLPYFLFCENGTETVLSNPAAQAQGGAGIKAAQFLVDQGAEALITVRCGQNAADVFGAAQLKVFKAESVAARPNIQALEEGKLSPLTTFHAGYHGIR